MSISVLYVYSPTTFSTDQSDTAIDSIDGSHLTVDQATHQITLQPGVYRLPSDANITVANGVGAPGMAAANAVSARPSGAARASSTAVNGESCDLVPITNTKGRWPDPPLRAVEQLQVSPADIDAFLRDAGDENEI